MEPYFKQVFDVETYRNLGHQLVELLADHLARCQNDDDYKVILRTNPEDELTFWQNFNQSDPIEIWKTIINRSTISHHPRYMGHQVATPAPLANLATLLGAHLNNGMAVYEVGPAGNAIEKWVVDQIKPYFGFQDNGDGFLTSGGTIANLTALLCARSVKASQIWKSGTSQKYAFMVSEEAHYCVDRAVRIMGWGDGGLIKIPVDAQYKMNTDLLQKYYEDAISNGITVLGVVGSAPTTSTGIHDDLEAIGNFCIQNQLWFHVDGAHGGAAIFSDKYKYLLKGVSMADSIIIDAHKMMMNPGLATLVLFKNGVDSYRTFSQEAQYLWSSNQGEWYNYGKRTMECTKLMMAVRLHTMIQVYGMEVFGQHIDHTYDMGKYFAELIIATEYFELAIMPECNIVCFRILPPDVPNVDELNAKIRSNLIDEGDFFIVQTIFKGSVYLRTSIMNPMTRQTDFIRLLDRISNLANEIIPQL